eukprot:CAMPEP_0115405180 /NCGR_PEP_ID=MMETSP0271-20121206/17798_1 /TAXON_ID=71861 /ORGANISM="Scrippsiella trochoidea, Strain CCMP3099" /LENGTH=92 /DNA_ID=CAMNT_0002829173 /DNA_START=314 /DNA_END=592 /DNA_ORIENTATION=+
MPHAASGTGPNSLPAFSAHFFILSCMSCGVTFALSNFTTTSFLSRSQLISATPSNFLRIRSMAPEQPEQVIPTENVTSDSDMSQRQLTSVGL